jgi:hypothetical protein
MIINKFSYKGYLMGRVKFNLPNLVKNKRPTFRPRKIIFLNGEEKPVKIKGSFSQTSLNFWKRNYLLKKETSTLYGFTKSAQTRHYLNILSAGKRPLFSKVESQLNTLLVRVGWALDLKEADKLITQGIISVNGLQVKSKLKVLSPGSLVKIHKDIRFRSGVDSSFLPHILCINCQKFVLLKDPEFCPEILYFDLKKGLKNLC